MGNEILLANRLASGEIIESRTPSNPLLFPVDLPKTVVHTTVMMIHASLHRFVTTDIAGSGKLFVLQWNNRALPRPMNQPRGQADRNQI